MTKQNDKTQLEDPENPLIREEMKLQFHWYLLAFFTIFTFSFLIPGIIFTLYIYFVFTPLILENTNFIMLFLDFKNFVALIFMPIIIITCYLLHLFFVALLTRIFWRHTEKISPTKDGKIPRNIQSKALNYYNIRSFMIKYPKNAFVKGPFPWLLNWFYNFVGSNKIGKGTTIEEQFGADRHVNIGENCYIGVNSGFSSHAVEGIFGDIAYFKIKLGDNITTSALNCLAPGVEINNNSYLLPMAGATKHSKLKGNNFYFGAPLRKIFKKKIMNYLNISEKELELNESYNVKKKSAKNNK